jgi:hypothetical protein
VVFIGQRGAGASLSPPYHAHGEWGLPALPRRRARWPMGVDCRAWLRWFLIMRGSGALGFGRARPGEEEGGTVSLKTTLFCSFFYRKRRRFRQNALFHLNKIWRQNTSTSKSVLNLSFIHLSPQMQFWF